jgi:hypothetical protein
MGVPELAVAGTESKRAECSLTSSIGHDILVEPHPGEKTVFRFLGRGVSAALLRF